MRVLIAGSDQPCLEIAQSFLWDRGHEIEIAADDVECLTMLREFEPDVLVLENDLLRNGGQRLMAHLCEDADSTRIPIVLVAGEDTHEHIDEPVHSAIVSWLGKPLRLGELLTAIVSAGRSQIRENWTRESSRAGVR